MPGGVIDREFIDRRCDRTFGRRTPHAKNAQCVVACVDVQPVFFNGNGSRKFDPDILCRLAIQRIERCLRPGDLICLMGAGRLAVCFGHGADRTTAAALGLRLASAMGDHLSVSGHDQDLEVAVGVGTGTSSDIHRVVSAATAAAGAARRRQRDQAFAANGDASLSRVVVSQVRAGRGPQQSREVVTSVRGHDSYARHPLGVVPLAGNGHHRASEVSVLVVGTETRDPTRTDPAVEMVLNTAARTGAHPTLASAATLDDVLDRFTRQTNELVVLALGSETAVRNLSAGPATPWERWAHVSRDFVRSGATVLAVGVGASVAAIAMCVREGAIGVLDLAEFAEHLEKVGANLASRRLAAENGARETARGTARGGLPSPYNRLVDLTTSEHRVLHQMMRGVSASEIAEELVVSLATVRSHIRSILRKLQVSSQLGAVALANGVRPDMTARSEQTA